MYVATGKTGQFLGAFTTRDLAEESYRLSFSTLVQDGALVKLKFEEDVVLVVPQGPTDDPRAWAPAYAVGNIRHTTLLDHVEHL